VPNGIGYVPFLPPSQGCESFSLSTGLSGHEGLSAEHDAYASANFSATDGSGLTGSLTAKVQYEIDGSGSAVWEASGNLFFSKAGGVPNTEVEFVVSQGGEEVRVNYNVSSSFTATCTGGRSADGTFSFTIGVSGSF
jgi:hypothetical protein